MGLAMAIAGLSAAYGAPQLVGTVSLPDNPPVIASDATVQLDAFEKDFGPIANCGERCTTYERSRSEEQVAKANAVALNAGCYQSSVVKVQADVGLSVSCRTTGMLVRPLAIGALVCGLLALFGFAVSWIVAGFERTRAQA
jgi:hypothetical protein